MSDSNGGSTQGMTMRQYYKAAALQGIVSNEWFFGPTMQQQPESAAEFAAKCADFMLAEDMAFERGQP